MHLSRFFAWIEIERFIFFHLTSGAACMKHGSNAIFMKLVGTAHPTEPSKQLGEM
jgi:hypothetical protein